MGTVTSSGTYIVHKDRVNSIKIIIPKPYNFLNLQYIICSLQAQ